jgi:ABC-2 type transport system permease protein
MISAMISFALLLIFWLADAAAGNLGAPARDIFRYLSITQHFQDFPRGVIDTTHVVFFLSLIVGCLLLTMLSLQSRRWR